MAESTFVKVPATVARRSSVRPRDRGAHVAACGTIDAEGATEKEARDLLGSKIARFFDTMGAPMVMFDFDGVSVWIIHPTPEGWGYSIAHRAPAVIPPAPVYGCSIGGNWTREEAEERMRVHWYSQNAQLIVDGIVALFTDRREFVCRACQSPTISGAPYVCRNPRCGAVFTPHKGAW